MADEEEAGTESAETDAQAREHGWVPKEEYKGDPKHWKPAAVWLEQAPKNYIPKLEKRIGQLEGQLAKKETEFADRLKRLEGATRTALKNERTRIEAEAEARILKATELGDTEGVKKALTDQKRDMTALAEKAEAAEETTTKEKPKDGALPADVQEALDSWAKENEWFGTDRRLRRVAIALYDEVEEDMPGATPKAKLTEVTKRIKEEFPAKFGTEEEEDEPRRNARVEGGARITNGGGKKQTWQAIPSADREMAKQVLSAFLKKGETLETHLAQAHDRYAAEYWKDQAAA